MLEVVSVGSCNGYEDHLLMVSSFSRDMVV